MTRTSQKGYRRPETLIDIPTHYCPGCGHGIVHRLLAEIIEEQGLRDRIIGMAPVGCAVMAYCYLDIDMCEAAHGRTPAVATGIKRALPDRIVFTYQGDGDLAAIGTAEIIHAANRGENLSVIFINNAVYGMTQGQMAPTTLLGQKTTTTPHGRRAQGEGHPIRVCELLATLGGAAYLVRTTVTTPQRVRETRKAIERAFLTQEKKKGFSLVEVLSPCPTYWHMGAAEAMRHTEEVMTKTFPLGVVRDWEE
ncbi:MAG TPA: thiamine pyrophosphate-dependent enzyme [Planctomycetota bacterium]|nr:thiamine pyrophosphate-dependent enzyme [Planctomycetota bacterium]